MSALFMDAAMPEERRGVGLREYSVKQEEISAENETCSSGELMMVKKIPTRLEMAINILQKSL